MWLFSKHHGDSKFRDILYEAYNIEGAINAMRELFSGKPSGEHDHQKPLFVLP